MKTIRTLLFMGAISLSLFTTTVWETPGEEPGKKTTKAAPAVKRYLYVVTPGARNCLGYGGHGIHVFDIDNGHKPVKFIPGLGGLRKDGKPSNVGYGLVKMQGLLVRKG